MSGTGRNGQPEPAELRATFDQDAELYDRARPRYPAELIDDLARFAELRPGARVVEVGPGTGQATAALAGLGVSVTAVELGPGLAAVLAHRLDDVGVDVVVSAFEDWPVPAQPFDVLAAFTAWHWLDPAVRGPKAATAIRPGGSLVTVTTEHVAGTSSDPFFADIQACYERWDPTTPPGVRLQPADELGPFVDEIDTSELFEPAERRRYQQDITYSARRYLDVLATYSGHRALPAERQRGLFACIEQRIAAHGGSVTKRYLHEMRMARRR